MNNQTQPKKAYGYIRVSTEEQVDGASLDMQRESIKNYCQKNNIKLVKIYEDPGISAKTARRPDLLRMLSDIRAKKQDITSVIAYSSSRMSRDTLSFFSEIFSVLSKYKKELIFVQENASSNTAQGRLTQNLGIVLGQFDNDVKSEYVKDAMRAVAADGWNQSEPPLGFTSTNVSVGSKEHSVLVPDNTHNRAAIVKDMLLRFSEGGMTVTELANYANKKGLCAKNGSPLNYKAVERMLRNPAYAGFIQSEKLTDNKRVKARWEGFIDEPTYDRNIAIMNSQKYKNCHRHYNKVNSLFPLKGTLICPNCQKPMCGSCPIGGSGKPSPRYHCPRCKGTSSMPPDEMHPYFLRLLREIVPKEPTLKLFSVILQRVLKNTIAKTKKEMAEKEHRLQEISNIKPQIIEKAILGKITTEEKELVLENFKKETATLNVELEQLREQLGISENGIARIVELMRESESLWSRADCESRQLLQQMVFPEGLEFDFRKKKFGTVVLSPLYSVIPPKKGRKPSNLSRVVRD